LVIERGSGFRFAPKSKATVGHQDAILSCVPEPHRTAATASLFDHLIGAGEQRRWNVDAERPGGLEVDDEIELGGPQDRQVGRFLALENVAGIDASLEILVPISSIRSSSARRLPPTRVRDRLMVPRVARQA